jgi:hypothetical protein
MQLTCETGCHKNLGKATKATNERSTRNVPIVCSDVGMRLVDADIDEDTNDDEDHDGSNLQERKPILCRKALIPF